MKPDQSKQQQDEKSRDERRANLQTRLFAQASRAWEAMLGARVDAETGAQSQTCDWVTQATAGRPPQDVPIFFTAFLGSSAAPKANIAKVEMKIFLPCGVTAEGTPIVRNRELRQAIAAALHQPVECVVVTQTPSKVVCSDVAVHKPLKPATYSVLVTGERIFGNSPSPQSSPDHTKDEYVDDLTREGIEPNPGPTSKKKSSQKKKTVKMAADVLRAVEKKKNKKLAKRAAGPGIRGDGSYDLDRLGGKIGGLFGSGGESVGKFLGSAADTVLDIFGMGDYKVRQQRLNDAYKANPGRGTMKLAGVIPEFHATEDYVEFKFRESMGDVMSCTTFSNVVYNINPARMDTFSYLSQMAEMFQQAEFRGLIFEFISDSGTYTGSTPSLGKVILSSQYNNADPDFVEARDAENNEFSISGTPDEDLVHMVECKPSATFNPIKFTRTQATTSTITDINDYDLCKLNVITTLNPTTGSLLGELWASYVVRLYKPSANINVTRYYCHATSYGTTFDGTTAPILQDSYEALAAGLNAGMRAVSTYVPKFRCNASGTALDIQMPVINGRFNLQITMQCGGSATFTSAGTLTLANCSQLTYDYMPANGYSMLGGSAARSGVAYHVSAGGFSPSEPVITLPNIGLSATETLDISVVISGIPDQPDDLADPVTQQVHRVLASMGIAAPAPRQLSLTEGNYITQVSPAGTRQWPVQGDFYDGPIPPSVGGDTLLSRRESIESCVDLSALDTRDTKTDVVPVPKSLLDKLLLGSRGSKAV